MATRTVLVTGAARGIGKGIADAFLRAGHRVMIADLATSPDWNYDLATDNAMKETLDDLSPLGEVDGVDVDVTQEASCQRAIDKTLETFGQLDVLVNNAGVVDSGPIESFSEATWDQIFAVNVKGIFLMSKMALPTLKASSDAAIVSTASIAGKRGSANLAAYCASKFAAVGLTQSMAQEFAPFGIRVNAICPGVVGTAMWLDHLMANQGESAFDNRMTDMMPLGRPQTANDMGQAAVYLATAPNVTGVSLNVAGGFEMH
ncbi:MAG: SDR family oxidoreductase [Pseudomonadota bacterium]|nr:SDR family oxidoreductase [Pseudomonadota bacterium]